MTSVRAPGFPEHEIRRRARTGAAAVFPPVSDYGHAVFGQSGTGHADPIDAARLTPPVFVARRLERLIDLAREPTYLDVELSTVVGGFDSALPLYVSALGSTAVASRDLGGALCQQASRLGIPLVIGENVVPMAGYRGDDSGPGLLRRLRRYTDGLTGERGGLVVQQSTEDADAEVWNQVYSDPAGSDLAGSGRLAFELKVGQGAKPGLGGMTVLDASAAARAGDQFVVDPVFGSEHGKRLRSSSPGTFTEEILRQQIRLMRNNFPRALCWVKLSPARDVGRAARIAWAAGADAVTVDGAEAGTGWAPTGFLDHVGLPLAECLTRIGTPESCLLVSGGMWQGARIVKCLAMGATAAGLGRAALLAADEDAEAGLIRLVESIAMELRLLVSALGKYTVGELGAEDLWFPRFGMEPERGSTDGIEAGSELDGSARVRGS